MLHYLRAGTPVTRAINVVIDENCDHWYRAGSYLLAGPTGFYVKITNSYNTTNSTAIQYNRLLRPHQPSLSVEHHTHSEHLSPEHGLYTYCLSLLSDLDGVMQSPRYHPERDALYHSLQVFQCAKSETDDPELLAAALFHDVGKAIDYPNHDHAGAQALSGVLSERICWLIRHHLDLLIAPARCRRRYAGSLALADLEALRRWDLAGRRVDVEVITEHQALEELAPYLSIIAPAHDFF